MPTLRSEIWNGTSWPNSVTPGPNGITAKASNAGNTQASGASR